MLKKLDIKNLAFIAGLVIFTVIVFQLSTGWFTIVMSVFATLVFTLILLSPDEKEKQ